jgi:amino acid transporter
MPPGAVLVAAVIPALITLMPSATVARIITFAVVGIYISFQIVVLGALIARARGWKPAGSYQLGSAGWLVNAAALAYGVAAIVILSIKSPHGAGFWGSLFLDRWLVPISAAVVAVIGLVYLFGANPKSKIREDARADGSPEPPESAPAATVT